MLNVTMYPAPGPSSAVGDLPIAAADLGTVRYRRWVEITRQVAALGRRPRQERGPALGSVIEPAPIGIPSPASGTLSRLP